MFRYFCYLFVFFLTSFYANSAIKPQTLPVSSYIDKSKLYPYSLAVESHPSSFLLLYKQNEERFDDAVGTITVTSNIPAEESIEFRYALQLIENESRCEKIIGDTGKVVLNIMNVFIDGVEVEEGGVTSSNPLDKLNEDGYRYGESSVLLRSDTIDDGGLECAGSVVVIAEMAL